MNIYAILQDNNINEFNKVMLLADYLYTQPHMWACVASNAKDPIWVRAVAITAELFAEKYNRKAENLEFKETV